jgi:hypothetical protein
MMALHIRACGFIFVTFRQKQLQIPIKLRMRLHVQSYGMSLCFMKEVVVFQSLLSCS